MDWYEIFYWATIADGVKTFFDVSSNITTAFAVAGFVFYASMWAASLSTEIDEDKKSLFYRNRKLAGFLFWGFAILSLTTWLGYVATPTKKDALMIIAGGGAMQYLTTDSIASQIPREVSTFLVTEIKQMAKDAKVELGILSEKDKILESAKQMTTDELLQKMQLDSNFANVILNN